jgi:hypothetical protein
MDRKAHLLEAIVDEAILAAGNRKNAVATVAEGIFRDGFSPPLTLNSDKRNNSGVCTNIFASVAHGHRGRKNIP